MSVYQHPLDDAAYVFGPEDGSVGNNWKSLCHEFVYIPSRHCLNLAAAVNVVLSHRLLQRMSMGVDSELWSPAVHEDRGLIDVPGWDGN